MFKSIRFQSAFLGLAFALTPAVNAQEHGHDKDHDSGHAHAEQPQKKEFSGDPYLLDSDPVTGEKLGAPETLVILRHEGRELRFKDEESASAFRAEPAKYLPKVDQALVLQQIAFYPLETCPVSGEELGSMGDPIDVIVGNRLVRLCCKGCKSKLAQDPGKIVAKLDAAVIAAQGPKYPLTTCVVSGEALGGEMGEPIDRVVGNRLVRLCCKGCEKKLAKDPLALLAKLDAAAKAEHGHGDKEHGGGHDKDGDHGHDGHQ